MSDYDSGVSAEALNAWMTEHEGSRAPINPAVSGQSVPQANQFVGNGRPAPDPSQGGTVEPNYGQPGSAGGAGSGQAAPQAPPDVSHLPPPEAPSGPVGQPPTPPADASGAPTAPQTTPHEPSQPSPDEYVTLADGVTIPRSTVNAYYQFDQVVREDPRLQRIIAEYLTTGSLPADLVPPAVPPPSPVQQPPPPAPAPEYRDPWADLQPQPAPQPQPASPELESLRAELRQLQGVVQNTYNAQVQAQQAENQAIVNRVTQSFAAQHQLTEDEVLRIRGAATRLNVLPSLLSGIDPITGAPTRPDPMTAVERAMEIAYYQMPEFRQREWDRQRANMHEDAQRKQKLAGVSGSSASAPRVAAPTSPTPQSLRQQAVAEVAQMLSGTWANPE